MIGQLVKGIVTDDLWQIEKSIRLPYFEIYKTLKETFVVTENALMHEAKSECCTTTVTWDFNLPTTLI